MTRTLLVTAAWGIEIWQYAKTDALLNDDFGSLRKLGHGQCADSSGTIRGHTQAMDEYALQVHQKPPRRRSWLVRGEIVPLKFTDVRGRKSAYNQDEGPTQGHLRLNRLPA